MAMAVALGAMLGCSSLPSDSNGVVALRVTTPPSTTLRNGQSLNLEAVALDIDGNPVAADLRWQSPDTLLVSLDSITGVITGIANAGVARVQVSVGSLRSSPISFTLAPADTSAGLRAGP